MEDPFGGMPRGEVLRSASARRAPRRALGWKSTEWPGDLRRRKAGEDGRSAEFGGAARDLDERDRTRGHDRSRVVRTHHARSGGGTITYRSRRGRGGSAGRRHEEESGVRLRVRELVHRTQLLSQSVALSPRHEPTGRFTVSASANRRILRRSVSAPRPVRDPGTRKAPPLAGPSTSRRCYRAGDDGAGPGSSSATQSSSSARKVCQTA